MCVAHDIDGKVSGLEIGDEEFVLEIMGHITAAGGREEREGCWVFSDQSGIQFTRGGYDVLCKCA